MRARRKYLPESQNIIAPKRALWLAVVLLLALPAAAAAVDVTAPSPAGVTIQCDAVSEKLHWNEIAKAWECQTDQTDGAGGGAPTDASYITQTPNGTLAAEQALSLLGSGILLNTTTTGVLSIYGGASCTNQFIRALAASGLATCASVGGADFAAQSTNTVLAGPTSGSAAPTFRLLVAGDIPKSPAGGVVVGSGRQILTSGTALSGGGDLSADRTLTLSQSPAGSASVVGTGRAIATSAPLSGGGDLSGDRTLACPTCLTQAYATAADEGTPLTQRSTLNFTGAGVACADNAGASRTDCTIAGGGGGAAWGDITGTLANQTDLQAALDGKAGASHTHAQSAITDLVADLAAKAASVHTHVKADVTDFGHTHLAADLPTATTTAKGLVELATDGENAASVAVQGNDARLSNARTPTAHSIIGPEHTGFPGGTTTFLRADGAFAAPSGGSDPYTYAKVTGSNFATTSATAVDVTGLAFTPSANTDYEFEGWLMIRTATATVMPRTGLAWPTGMTDGTAIIKSSIGPANSIWAMGNINAALLIAVSGLTNTTQSWPVEIKGMIRAGSSPSGTLRIQLASETAGTTVQIQIGSFLKFRTIP